MKLQLDHTHVLALAGQFPALGEGLQDQLRFGHRVELRSHTLPLEALEFLARLYEDVGVALAGRAAPAHDLFGRASQVRGLVAALRSTSPRFGPGDVLEALLPAVVRYLAHGSARGWLFAAKGVLKETPELLAAYDASVARYFEWRGRYGAQFAGHGVAFIAEDPSATHRVSPQERDWSRKDQVILSAAGGAARLVNDEGILPPRSTGLESPGDILAPYLRRAAKSSDCDCEEEVKALDASLPKQLFTQLPVQAYLFLFHLELHQHLWVHVDDMAPYVYQPELRHKLVLPPEQTELIDILTAEMDVLQDDVVAGKGGGTTVLCAGPPGVVTTLTAEVYAEVSGRPLYRVHSGQLGLSVGAMEVALKEALTRAQRWGAVMLIDEAIVSRCIALIRYHPPDATARARIWRVMAAQFGLALDAALITTLAVTYPQASGRDIKGLAKLVAKFCAHKAVPPTLDAQTTEAH